MRALTLAALVAATLPGAASAAAGVPWIHDDYARALAEARARQVPIVVDVWAPW